MGHIANTLQLDEREISESVVKEAQPMPFDRNKNMVSRFLSGQIPRSS